MTEIFFSNKGKVSIFQKFLKCILVHTDQNILVEHLNNHILDDIKEHSETYQKARELVADSNFKDVENIRRTYFGLNGGGKDGMDDIHRSYDKLRGNQEVGDRLREADNSGCTFKAFSYALSKVFGEDTDKSIRPFEKKKESEYKRKRDLSKTKTKLKELDAEKAYNYRWSGASWAEILALENRRQYTLTLAWNVTLIQQFC